MLKKLLLAAFAALISATVHATDWREVFNGATAGREFVDVHSIQQRSSSVNFRYRMDYYQDQPAGNLRYNRVVSDATADCGRARITTRNIRGYARNNNLLFTIPQGPSFVPESSANPMSKLLRYICNG